MSKDTKIFVELVVVLALVIFGVWSMTRNSTAPATTEQTVDSVEDTTSGDVNASTPAAVLAYAQALAKYKGARIQLDPTCQATSDNATFKNGTYIMVDNRSAVARTVKVGSTFGIKAWGFKIIKLYSATLPATWYIDCDSSQNVSTILIQK